jgi:hypothetical protein
MKTSNVVSENLRQAETGLMWEEQLTNAMGTLALTKQATFRVRATGATTVTIDGVLAMTMSAGEIVIFNTGTGSMADTGLRTIAVVIAGAAAFVQVAREVNRLPLQVNPFNHLNLPQDGDQSL